VQEESTSEEVMKLVIDRNVWLRGEGQGWSYLLRPGDGKMCCVGIFLEACGVSREVLRGTKTANQARRNHDAHEVEKIPDWMDNTNAGFLYDDNDDRLMSEDERERRVARRFAGQGVEVEFIN
jgi:hypothetical protein